MRIIQEYLHDNFFTANIVSRKISRPKAGSFGVEYQEPESGKAGGGKSEEQGWALLKKMRLDGKKGFVTGDASSFTTGADFVIDGAFTCF